MSTCKALLCIVILYVASPLAWAQSPDCRPETVEYYIGRLHHTPPMKGCQVDAMSSYVGKYGYRTQIGYQSSPRPAGEIVFQYPSADQPLPFNRTFTLNVPNGSPQQPNNPQTGYIDTPSVIQSPKKTGHKLAALADVRVSNALSRKPPFHSGEEVVFLIVVENYGPSPARGVDVYLEPKNLAITGVSGSCNSAICLLGDLKRGSKRVVHVAGVISADGDFSLLATVRHTDPDPDMQNNASVAGDHASPAPPPPSQFAQLSVDNELPSKGSYHAGDNVEFLVLVRNVGTGAASEVEIKDDFLNLRLIRVEGDCKQLPCSVASIQGDAGLKFLVRARIIGEGQFTSAISATSAQGTPGSASAGGEALGQPVADLSLTNILSSGNTLRVGDSAEFRVKLQNNGRVPANGVQVMGDFTNLELVSVDGSCRRLPCRLASLPPGAIVDLVMHATIMAKGQFRSTITATSAQTRSMFASASGTALPPTFWDWIKANVATAVGGALALSILVFGGATFAHRAWWRTRIKAKADLERAGSTRVSRPVPTLAPSVSLRVRLEPGSAEPSGRVPILKEEVCRD